MFRFGFSSLTVLLCAALVGCGGGNSAPPTGGGGGGGVAHTVANCGGGTPIAASNQPFWPQWGSNPQHTGQVNTVGQNLIQKLADITYDPFVQFEKTENLGTIGDDLTVHEQVPITDGNDVYMVVKAGTYTSCASSGAWENGAPCGPNAWQNVDWCEARYTWIGGTLTQQWAYESDWKPEPNGTYNGVPGFSSPGLVNWEPVFHPALANSFMYVPGAGGTVWKIDKNTGVSVSHIDPFAGTGVIAANTYISGPLSVDANGNVFYNVIQFADPSGGNVWSHDVVNAWLVAIAPNDTTRNLTYASLVQGVPNTSGSQRPGINVAPAIAPDGTLYTSSRAHMSAIQSYLVSVDTQTLTAKWAVPLAAVGSAAIVDEASSSPTVLPDGSVAYGVLNDTGFGKGHTVHFDAQGTMLGTYPWGWDETPAVWSHNGTYSLIMKDSGAGGGTGFFITQLDANLNVEWRFQNTTVDSSHPNGYEFCINMAAVDSSGNVYVNSEDGNAYEIPQGNTGTFTTPLSKMFLDASLGAAYTPLSLGQDGKLYTQNNGHMIVVGN
jgi:hypothetical protein